MSDETALTMYQKRRIEALQASRAVLVQTNLFGANPTRSIDDLIKLSTWILGPEQQRADNPLHRVGPDGAFGVLEIDPSDLPSFLSAMAGITEDCGHDDCPVHAPLREAKDLNPDDAKSSFDRPTPETVAQDLLADTGGIPNEGQERPDDTEAGDPGYKYPEEADLEDGEGPLTPDEEDTRPIPIGEWQDVAEPNER